MRRATNEEHENRQLTFSITFAVHLLLVLIFISFRVLRFPILAIEAIQELQAGNKLEYLLSVVLNLGNIAVKQVQILQAFKLFLQMRSSKS